MSLVADHLTFCHYQGSLWWFVGLLQFTPWFIGPAFFLASHWGNADIFLRLLSYYGKILLMLLWTLQEIIRQPVPYPGVCTDIWGSAHGQPSIAAGLITMYCWCVILHLIYQYKRCHKAHCDVTFPFSTVTWALAVDVIILVVLYVHGLHSLVQVGLGAALGFGFTLLAMWWTYDIFVPFLMPIMLRGDPYILGKIFGHYDTMLRPHMQHYCTAELERMAKKDGNPIGKPRII